MLKIFARYRASFKPLDKNNHYDFIDENALAKLPDILQFALYLYTTDEGYLINQLMRGRLDQIDQKYKNEADQKAAYVQYFLLCCLVNQVVNQLPHLYSLAAQEESKINYQIIKTNSQQNAEIAKLAISQDKKQTPEQAWGAQQFIDQLDIQQKAYVLAENKLYLINKETNHIIRTDITKENLAALNDKYSSIPNDGIVRTLSLEERTEIQALIRPAVLARHDKTMEYPNTTTPFRWHGFFSTSTVPTAFLDSGNNRTYSQLINPDHFPELRAISCYRNEREILLPTNQLFIRDASSQHLTQVNGPNIVSNHFFSDSALRYVYEEILSKPYSDLTDCDAQYPYANTHKNNPNRKNPLLINRPNHGLAHTFRVMNYSVPVSNYFAQHAKDPAIKKICQNPSNAFIQLAEIVAAFSVSGRINEKRPNEMEKMLFDQTKENAGKNFIKFCDANPVLWKMLVNDLKLKDENNHLISADSLKEKIASIIKILCFKNIHGQDGLYDSLLPFEKTLWNIVSMGHDIDLPRCYRALQCDVAIGFHDRFVNTDKDPQLNMNSNHAHPHEAQKKDLAALREMAQHCITTMGDNLKCELNSVSGKMTSLFIPKSIDDTQFSEYSLSPKYCCDMRMHLASPQLSEPTQGFVPRMSG